MSLLSGIIGKIKKKKRYADVNDNVVKVEVVKYVPPPAKGEPTSEERRALLRHWLNGGEKPPGLVKMEKNIKETMGSREQAGRLTKAARGTGKVIGSFAGGFIAGAGFKKPSARRAGAAWAKTIFPKQRKPRGGRDRGRVRGPDNTPSSNPLSGFDNAFTAFDIPMGGSRKGGKRAGALSDMNINDSFDKAFEGFRWN